MKKKRKNQDAHNETPVLISLETCIIFTKMNLNLDLISVDMTQFHKLFLKKMQLYFLLIKMNLLALPSNLKTIPSVPFYALFDKNYKFCSRYAFFDTNQKFCFKNPFLDTLPFLQKFENGLSKKAQWVYTIVPNNEQIWSLFNLFITVVFQMIVTFWDDF